MIRTLALALLATLGTAAVAFAQSVDINVTTPFSYGDTLGVNWYIDPGSTCNYIQWTVSGSSGFYAEGSNYGSSYGSGGDTDVWADTSTPYNTYSYSLDASWSYSGIESCGNYPSGSDWITAYPAYPFYPAPSVQGLHEVYWFNNSQPQNYNIVITLTSSAGDSTQWSVVSGADKVSLSSQTGSSVNILSTAKSETRSDVVIAATAPDSGRHILTLP